MEQTQAEDNWGFPGYLTPSQELALKEFRKLVDTRRKDEAFMGCIFKYDNEEEEYALCRWLRARNFDMRLVNKMILKAIEMCNEPRLQGYYPNAPDVLGVDPKLLQTQLPNYFFGFSKEGFPVHYTKVGPIDFSIIEILTTMDNLHKHQWAHMVHDMRLKTMECKERDPNFKRFQVVSVIDLDGLKVNQINRRMMNYVRHQNEVDSFNFPEMLRELLIINAPRIFSEPWKVIKRWIDERTVSKIEVVTGKRKSVESLQKRINPDELPPEYGGPVDQETLKENKILTKRIGRSGIHRVGLLENDEAVHKIELYHKAGGGSNTYTVLVDSKRLGTIVTQMGTRKEELNIDIQGPALIEISSECRRGQCVLVAIKVKYWY